MIRADAGACLEIRDFLDEVQFAYMSYQLVPGHDSVVFPSFASLQLALDRLSPLYRFLFTVFRQGHAADPDIAQKALPPRVLQALLDTGLLAKNRRNQYQSPSLAIVPVEGLHLVVSLPPYYPTSDGGWSSYLGPDSFRLTRALPAHLGGLRVLSVCAGAGLYALLCAARGAERVVALEKIREAVAVARLNVVLNGFEDRVEVRESDLYSALAEDETFDLILSQPPAVPIDGVDYPPSLRGGTDGLRVLSPLLQGLPKRLSPQGEGLISCATLGDQYHVDLNRRILDPLAEEQHVFTRAYVEDKVPFSAVEASLVQHFCNVFPNLTAVSAAERIAAWKEKAREAGVPTEYIYTQILRVWKGRPEAGLVNLPAYAPHRTDPLLAHSLLQPRMR